jgi:putative DNA methylase
LNISGNIDVKSLQDNGIISLDKDSIALIEPDQAAKDQLSLISALEQLPDVRKAIQGDYNFSNPVEAFHYLEYISLKNPDKIKEEVDKLKERTRFVDEALAIAKILAKVLDDSDVEKEPSKRLSGEKTNIERWVQ